MERATLDAIGLAGFGHAFKSVEGDEEQAKQVEYYHEVVKSINNPLRYLFRWYPKLPIESNRRTERAYAAFEKFITEIIDEKRITLKKRLEEAEAKADQSLQQYDNDILDALILANIDLSKSKTEDLKQAQLSDKELLQNVYLFFIAGHETSASALTFTIHLLQQHPECQTRAREEVLRVLGDSSNPSWENIRDLPYLEACLKEAMRLYPPAIILSRVIHHEGVVAGYHMPEGALVAIPTLSLQRSKLYWDDPERFDPNRFMPGGKQQHQHPLAWMPFGTGARQCLGMNFAMLEMKLLLAFLLRRFSFEADPNCKVPFDFDFNTSMNVVNGHTIKLRRL